MKRLISIVFFFINLCPVFSQNEKDTIRILAIGNSFSQDAVENYLYQLADAAGVSFVIGNAHIGGTSLQQHSAYASANTANYYFTKIVKGNKTTTSSQTLATCLQDEPWDYISFQQVSQNSGKYNTYFSYLPNLINYVKGKVTNSGVKYVLHQTWAYAQNSTHNGFVNYGNDQQVMFDSIVNTVRKVKEKVEDIAFVIPAGTAIQNGRTSSIGDNFCRDGYHLDLQIGRYTAACTWFEKITGINVVGNKSKPAGLGDFQVSVAQNAAHFAVLEPEKITSMSDFVIETGNTTTLQHPINISFGDAATSSTAWNSITNVSNVVVYGLKDSEGNDTKIIFNINDAFSGINRNGAATTNTVLNIPSDVSSSSFFGNEVLFSGKTEPTGGFEISNLNKNYTYDFIMFASRTGATNNRETYYTFKGINEATTTLNASGNTDKTAEVTAIQPDSDDKISVTIGAGSNNNDGNKFFYINAMRIVPKEKTSGIKTVEYSVDIYPNPVSDMLYISAADAVKNIELYDTTGKKIMQEYDIDKNEIRLNLSHLKNGFYLLQSKTINGGILTNKILKL